MDWKKLLAKDPQIRIEIQQAADREVGSEVPANYLRGLPYNIQEVAGHLATSEVTLNSTKPFTSSVTLNKTINIKCDT